MALESSASLITALLNQTLAAAINHVVQFSNGSSTGAAPPLSVSEGGSPFDTMQINDTMQSNDTSSSGGGIPQIPAYIRNTSMVFCIVIMCLGVIGNIMVSDSLGMCRTISLNHSSQE